jgi:predicted transcriptional regulator
MNLREIIEVIEGSVFTGKASLDIEIRGGCGADLMSDVLTSTQPDSILLTGLCNPQVVRTAQMADIKAIVFVRGKQPASETVALADREEIPLISSPFGMFELCGRLYANGLPSFEQAVQQQDCKDQ